MSWDLSRVISTSRLPRLLITENNLSTTEPLIRAFGDRRLDVDFDLCTSHSNALRKLLAAPYHLIISSAHLAEMDDCLLLKRAQELQPFVPFVVTARASDKEAARRVLERGALDLIFSPLDHRQTEPEMGRPQVQRLSVGALKPLRPSWINISRAMRCCTVLIR